MKNSKTKLPGLPGLRSVPHSPVKGTPPRSAAGSKSAGFSNFKTVPISFGRTSQTAGKSDQSGTQWSSLLKATTSGGISSTLSSVAGFGGGIGSIISGVTSLFGGGKSTPAALVAYQLPTSQQEVVSIGSSASNPGIYGGPGQATPFENQSGEIIQLVRQALLNSSSLNDVIADI
jgi:hypothetical protein